MEKALTRAINKGTSFSVDPVAPAEKALMTETLADSVARRLQRNIVIMPDGEDPVADVDPDLGNGSTRARGIPRRLNHPLIDAIHIAFSQHRPLALSPDAIWMVIAQGFGHHVAENSVGLRGRLVRHAGKKELAVTTTRLTLSSFEPAIALFSELVKRETDPVLHETLIADFSTTTAAIRTASEVALMDTFSSYFTYALFCVCGIPRVTIEGTPEDWRRIRARVEVLATYDLEWWVSRLRRILDEFVLAAEGHPNPDFWKAIYKPKAAYAVDMVTGWIADLFPYLGDPPERGRNGIFNSERRDWAVPVEYGVATARFPHFDYKEDLGVSRNSFPSGLSSARLKVILPQGSETEVDLLGGFMAVKQDPDLSLSPVIGWCVAELPPAKPVVVY